MATPGPGRASDGGPDARLLPDALRLGAVELTVTDLTRAVAWYQAALGLWIQRREPRAAELGDGVATSVRLVEDPLAKPAGRHAGLYHYALLYPSRTELARAVLRLARTRTAIQGASDHGTHEAIYLADPDGNGIELAADRPRESWPAAEEEFSRGGPRPLDVDALLAVVEGEQPNDRVEAGIRIGHVHLQVGDIDRGLRFYRDLVGFDVWFAMPSAAFVAAGGYHHHLGFNVWRGAGIGPAPEHTVGLRHWTIELESPEQVREVQERLAGAGVQADAVPGGFVARDPWDIAVHVVA